MAKVQGLSKQDYDADENLRLALVHLVQIIGEAARHGSETTRTALPDIPWREITGMRHKIVHDYMDTDEDLVWEDSVGKYVLGDKVGVWRCQTPVRGKQDACVSRAWRDFTNRVWEVAVVDMPPLVVVLERVVPPDEA